MTRASIGFFLIFLSVSMFACAFHFKPVRAIGTITINVDGSIDPPDAPISTVDNVTYVLTGNITSDADGIVIERDNIVVDGAGYTVLGNGNGTGINLAVYTDSVTIKNVRIRTFSTGIFLDDGASNNLISENEIDGGVGIALMYFANNNTLFRNNVTESHGSGIMIAGNGNAVIENLVSNTIGESEPSDPFSLGYGINIYVSDDNAVLGNRVFKNLHGIRLYHSYNNTLRKNEVVENGNGISLHENSGNNRIFHNNLISNTWQVSTYHSSISNIWDNGYPSGGNYWSDYNGTDADVDGIGDTPYIIDVDNQDRCPLMHPWSIFSPVHNMNTGLGYTTIQGAINDVETLDGHTIFVDAGSYHEHLTINKPLRLVGSGSDNTIINGDKIETFLAVIAASNVAISGFTFQNNSQTAIWLYGMSNITIRDNNIRDNNGHGIYAGDSEYIAVSNNRIISNGNAGIRFDWSSYSLLMSNEIIDNRVVGIGFVGYAESCRNDSIVGNRIENSSIGIDSYGCSSNSYWHNSLVNNSRQVSSNLVNSWDNGVEGNYWSDYNGTDSDGDGVGDTPYIIDGFNQDNCPLMGPYMPGDINHDSMVNIVDVVKIAIAYNSDSASPRWNPHCDLNQDGKINILDLVMVAIHFGEHWTAP